jgi:hypothetical protein
VRVVGGALHLHEFFEGVCHVQGSYAGREGAPAPTE